MTTTEVKPPLPTFERAIEVLKDEHGPADQDAFLECIAFVARLYGRSYDEVYEAAYER